MNLNLNIYLLIFNNFIKINSNILNFIIKLIKNKLFIFK